MNSNRCIRLSKARNSMGRKVCLKLPQRERVWCVFRSRNEMTEAFVTIMGISCNHLLNEVDVASV